MSIWPESVEQTKEVIIMPRLLLFVKLSVLFLFFFGCVAAKQHVGKRLPGNYYVCSCQSFPAKCFQKRVHFEFDYQVTKTGNSKYVITGSVEVDREEVQASYMLADRIDIVFFLVKDNLIVDSVTATVSGDLNYLKFKKRFISEADFDGITIGKYSGRVGG